MGEIADMMLDGTLCEGCGVYMDGAEPGHPRVCSSCQSERYRPAVKDRKVPCPTCNKRVKAVGLNDHRRDAHGYKSDETRVKE